MSNNKQSSVEWLVQEINQIIDFIPMNKWDVEADFGLISKTCGQAFLEALGQALGSKLTGTESQASVIEQILKNQTMSKDQKDDHIRSVQGSSCYFRTF